MPKLTRRSFLAGTAAAAAGAAVQSAVPGAAEAATGTGAARAAHRGGSLADVQHIIVFMQENRSFDHYFGTLRGVRGFADRSAIQLPNGNSVFEQPTGVAALSQYPWPMADNPPAGSATGEILAQCTGGTDHSWATQHQAWDNGKMDAWVPAKTVRAMGYLTRQDIPFHYALADAYTICDAYHCSVMSATGPNRTYLWSGLSTRTGQARRPGLRRRRRVRALPWLTYAETVAGGPGSPGRCTSPTTTTATTGWSTSPSSRQPAAVEPALPGVEEVPGSAAGTGPIDRLITKGIKDDLAAGTFPQVS